MTFSQSHLDALQLGLSNERARLAAAKTDGERALRTGWVRQLENQVADELALEADGVYEPVLADMDDEALLRELGL